MCILCERILRSDYDLRVEHFVQTAEEAVEFFIANGHGVLVEPRLNQRHRLGVCVFVVTVEAKVTPAVQEQRFLDLIIRQVAVHEDLADSPEFEALLLVSAVVCSGRVLNEGLEPIEDGLPLALLHMRSPSG